MLICWITNPIIILFANEEGELPKLFKYWQTWDDSLDSKFFMTEIVSVKYPFLDYNWNSKYSTYQDIDTLKDIGHIIDKVKLIGTFSLKERIQRYFCRLLWIMRNPAYGFAFYTFGKQGYLTNLTYKYNENINQDNELIFVYDKHKSLLTRAWSLKFYKHIIKNVYLTAYLGWKIPIWHNIDKYHCMIAYRVVFRFRSNKTNEV